MADRHEPTDLSRIRTYPLSTRDHRVSVERFGRTVPADATVEALLHALPDVLGAKALRDIATAIIDARRGRHGVALAIGGHVIKVGVSPVLIDLLDQGVITSVAMNGAAAIHDWEIAAVGGTSEDVADHLFRGRFGLADETGQALNDACRQAQRDGTGLGAALGAAIVRDGLPHRHYSILGHAHELDIPVTVHVSVGADIVHQHPSADGGAIGAASHLDFRRLISIVSELDGGVWINCGSAVQLPEVFLKALSCAINLGHDVRRMTTVNLDLQRHYRTDENVLRRPTAAGGTSLQLLGHHEINIPLLAAAIAIEDRRLGRSDR